MGVRRTRRTKRAEGLLSEPVVLALRVVPTKPRNHLKAMLGLPPTIGVFLAAGWGLERLGLNFWTSWWAGYVVSAVVTALLWSVGMLFAGDERTHIPGLLALTESGRRVLLTVPHLARNNPQRVFAELSPGADIVPDVELFESKLVVRVTVDGREFTVESTDFKLLMIAVESGEIVAPSMKRQLHRLRAVGGVTPSAHVQRLDR